MKTSRLKPLLHALIGTTVVAASAAAQPPEAPEVTVQSLAPDLHLLFGAGGGQVAGNVLALLGADGVVIVDTGFPAFVPKYRAAIAALGGGEVRVAINTHWHDDHAEGNKVFGPDGSVLVAHTNSREMLMHDNKVNVVRTVLDQPAYPAAALPVITYDERTELFLNGEQIVLLHFARAHTAGDTVVIFREHNVVHMGDVFLSAAYPFFDVDNGGDFDGLIEFCSRVLEEIDAATVVVPGHGRVATTADLAAYVEMLRIVRSRIAALIADGATLEQVVAAEPTREWDTKYGNPRTYFIDRAYESLAR
ncbi:MAG TPA: MBL fold metallo-hydrolase [Gammaproteobacteria bacterium]|jgi:glyoxylase-like metal-dependent hydrolase (beta-lactamase superfamily II)